MDKNCQLSMQARGGTGLAGLTFFNPKNLSVPSSRTGPALCNSFSTGVKSSGGSSFLFLVDAVLSDFEIP